MQMEDVSKKIAKLNSKIINANKEIDEMEFNLRQKRLEIKKYKNERARLQLRVKELELEKWKAIQQERKQKNMQKVLLRKYADDSNSEYYSQENNLSKRDNSFINYIERSLVPYND